MFGKAFIFISLGFYLFLFSGEIYSQVISKKDKIPKDLIIKINLSTSSQFGIQYILTIDSEGKVFYEDYSNLLPKGPSVSSILNLNLPEEDLNKSKISKKATNKPKLKEKLSVKQLKKIINEIDKSGFYQMNEYYEGCYSHAKSKSISISVNGKNKKVTFVLGCSYDENHPLKDFLNLFDTINKELDSVEKIKIEKSATNKCQKKPVKI